MEYGILFLLVIVIICYLETLFSNMENKYIGLILPLLSFAGSVVLTFMWMDSFAIGKMLFTLLIVNIPTYILILIYRHKRKKK